MKTSLTFLLTLLVWSICISQNAYNSVSAKQVESGIHSDGTLHFGAGKQSAGFNVTSHNNEDIFVGTIFAGGIWLGGIDESGNTAVIYPTYGGVVSGDNYQPGPYNYSGNYDFNEVWKVTGEDIRLFLLDWEDGVINDEIPLAIQRWPARGNTYYGTAINELTLANFYDEDEDGIYNPMAGDYPIIGLEYIDVIPAEMAYSVAHTDIEQGGLLELDLHTTMFSLECDESSILDRAIFTRHRVQTSSKQYDNFKFATWNDFDLGCYQDDYIGSNPDNHSFYAYNADFIDGFDIEGNCQGGVASFDFSPPVHGAKLLNKEMSSFGAVVNNAVQDPPPSVHTPQIPVEAYRLMQGTWRDGTPFTFGGIGFNPASTDVVEHLYVDDPIDTDGWSLYNDDAPFWDYRTIATTDIGTIFPGQSFFIDMVHIVTLDESYDHVEKVALNQQELDVLQTAYDNGFVTNCGVLNKHVMTQVKTEISILPNPNNGNFNISGPVEFTSYTIHDMVGRSVEKGLLQEGKTTIDIEVPAGLYLVRLQNDEIETQIEKIVIAN